MTHTSHAMASIIDSLERTLGSGFLQTQELRSKIAADKSLQGVEILRPINAFQLVSALAGQGAPMLRSGNSCTGVGFKVSYFISGT